MRTRRRPTRTACMPARTGQAGQAANCQDCHGGAHEVLAAADPKSPVNHANIPATCGRCHGQKFLMESNGESAQPFLSYQEACMGGPSRTGRRRPRSARIATARTRFCPPTIPSRRSTSSTCRRPAASAIRRLNNTFMQSIHGQGLRAATGWPRSARTATGSTPSSRTPIPTRRSRSRMSRADICARCHEGVRLSQEFGVPGKPRCNLLGQLSRAGRARRLGGGGQLLQLPRRAQHSAVERSALHHQRANLDATCGKCHKGVTQKFTLTPVHLERWHQRQRHRLDCGALGAAGFTSF